MDYNHTKSAIGTVFYLDTLILRQNLKKQYIWRTGVRRKRFSSSWFKFLVVTLKNLSQNQRGMEKVIDGDTYCTLYWLTPEALPLLRSHFVVHIVSWESIPAPLLSVLGAILRFVSNKTIRFSSSELTVNSCPCNTLLYKSHTYLVEWSAKNHDIWNV